MVAYIDVLGLKELVQQVNEDRLTFYFQYVTQDLKKYSTKDD